MKPYIISHMMMSVDARIDCPMVAQISGDEYYIALDSFGKSSKLTGRVTAALECSAVASEAEVNGTPVCKETYNKAADSDEYTIVVDTHGRLQIATGIADGHPLLVIMSEDVPEKHLAALREKGVSYIVTGEGHIDLRRAMEILGGKFGVEKVVIVGGGNINGGFLEAGLIDEVSVMIAPGMDGRRGMTAVFDGCTWSGNSPYRLHLQKAEQFPGTETVWLRYRCS